MPVETPRVPLETHQSMLRRNETPGLRLQAGEVAMFPRKRGRRVRLLLLMSGAALALMALGLGT